MISIGETFVEYIRDQIPEGFVALHEPEFDGNEHKYVSDTLESTFVSSVGEYVDRFEQSVAEFTGAKHAVAVSNGTSGLHLLLHAMGIGPGDLVITQSLTFVATCNAILLTGAEPVLLDSDPKTLGMSDSSLQKYLQDKTYLDYNGIRRSKKSEKRISAIMPMHVFGHPVALSELLATAAEYNLPVVEDAAEALGSVYQDSSIGTHTLASLFSFNGNKIVTTGGGGVITTNDGELAKKLKHMSTTAKQIHPYEFSHEEMAFNYRLPNLNAALGCAQMEALNDRLVLKRQLARRYLALATELSTEFVQEPEHCQSNYWLNNFRFESLEQRNQFLESTNAAGIQTRPLWRPMHMTPFLDGCERSNCTVAESLYETLVSIPSSARLGSLL